MSRADRLLKLIECLRRHRRPVSGRVLAETLGVSLRTLYRDIALLQGQGARVEGEAGLGYVLRPGFLLPPLMFSEEEIEALALGARWVAERGDTALAAAAGNALSKIGAVLPDELRGKLDTAALLVGPSEAVACGDAELAAIRQAIRRERKLVLSYADAGLARSERTVWPIALGFFERVQLVVAWCELRGAFRHFRIDRILALAVSDERYPRRRPALLKEWQSVEGIPADMN
jgi:predicted DNA-binding transcriptional regulator YafY